MQRPVTNPFSGGSMKICILALVFCVTLSFAQKTTIDLATYKNNANFSVAETPYTIGTHTFTLVNIQPRVKGDTACISAIVIDKRKFVLFDIGAQAGAYGLFVPPQQPLRQGLIVLKASASEGKTFIFLSTGKLITLPGAQTIVDTTGKLIYCVWENGPKYQLTVFNYKAMRVVVPTMAIKQPVQWYSAGASYCFSVPQEQGYYSVEMLTKDIVQIDQPEDALVPVPYLMDFSKIDTATCCSAKALKK
jgi:hypothetical protein